MRTTYHHCLSVQVDPARARVLLSDAPLNSAANRAKAVEVMFDEVGVGALCLQASPVLALFSQGARQFGSSLSFVCWCALPAGLARACAVLAACAPIDDISALASWLHK